MNRNPDNPFQFSVEKIEETANLIRQDIVRMLEAAGSGHLAGPLGMADIFATLYFNVLSHRPDDPNWKDRDRLILSNGHICPVRYATMARATYFPVEELLTLRKFGTRLQGHPEREKLPGVETTSGPLGSGLGQAAGIAYAAKMDGRRFWTFCLMSDGELNAGNHWEAAMFAARNRLYNLIGIIDRNNIQIDGFTEDVMPLEPLEDKWRSFGWHVEHISGHNIDDIIGAIDHSKAVFEKPSIIIAHTIPGKGVDWAEFDFRWHGSPPGAVATEKAPAKGEQVRDALRKLRTMGGTIDVGDL